jgi:small subunit ribosomal protein S5
MKALSKQNSPKQISIIRNKKISEIIEKRGWWLRLIQQAK